MAANRQTGDINDSVDGSRQLTLAAASTGQDDTRLLYDRVRLGIVTTLAVQRSAAFSELSRLLAVTDGNLSTHARKLKEAGLVKAAKRFKDNKPLTEYRITARGRKALGRYLEHMESIIRATRDSTTNKP